MYQDAELFHEKALNIAINQNLIFEKVRALSGLGYVYREIGELEKALNYFKKALEHGKLSKNLINFSKGMEFEIGITFYALGDIENAYSIVSSIYDSSSESNNNIIAYELYILVQISLDLKDYLIADEYLNKLKSIAQETDDIFINAYARLSEALILKKSKRMKDKTKAQVILESLLSEDILDRPQIIFHLADLLLEELDAFGDLKIIDDFEGLLKRFKSLIAEKKMNPYQVQLLVLSGKLSMIKGDLSKGIKLLDDALKLTQDNNLGHLYKLVSLEKAKFENEFETWQKLMKDNSPIHERIELAKMRKYIQEAQRMVKKSS